MCELSELDDVEWIWVKSLLGTSACAMNILDLSPGGESGKTFGG